MTDTVDTAENAGIDNAVDQSHMIKPLGAWSDLPDSLGFWWVKKQDGTTELLYLDASSDFKDDASEEAKDRLLVYGWICPGCEKYMLSWSNLPEWKWAKVVCP